MAKIIGFIPARLGSQRVVKKNLRLIAGKPLIAYIIETAKKSGVFDEIYINSEAEIFGEIAKEYGIKFYKRPDHLSTNEANNDAFAYDFIQNVPGDICVQLLPTSPLLTSEEIQGFIKAMIDGKFETMVSVVNHQIASLYQGKAINFSTMEQHKSSQTMTPVQSYATVLMAWTYQSFLKNMKERNCGYHGGASKIGYYPLKGLSTIDIDNEEDFAVAEVALEYQKNQTQYEKKYWEPRKEHSETDVPRILAKDGVMRSDFEHENLPLIHLKEIIASQDNSVSWCRRVVNTENNSATLISQLPGEGNRLHYHPDWNEWWYIVSGEWEWQIEGKAMRVKEGELVFIPKGKLHCITAVGNKPAVRLAVSKDKVPHIYPEGLK
jgi:CMP-N-acetylneuraminic acid synthetase/quercetin dioxygenase-like cupin family protein